MNNLSPAKKRALQIIKIGANHFGISLQELESHCRELPLATYRQAVMSAVHRSGYPSIQTGILFGRRSHATVLHASKSVRKKISKGDLIAADLIEFQRITSHYMTS